MESNYQYDNIKSDIINRFYDRKKVKIYREKLRKSTVITSDWLDEIRGISEEIKEDITDLFNLFDIFEVYLQSEMKFNHQTWWYTCSEVKSEDLDLYLPLFFIEFSIYPVSFIQNSKIKQ